ncbi:MAG: hypothetical protein JSV52_00580 [Candidatus Zixiibacteriota bacterium]|nr:MAG: hypothetical protein JSV52_00580 [candidate division Zixibacteria bacterium]
MSTSQHQFVIDGGSGKKAIFDSPSLGDGGLIERYRLTLESPRMTAATDVDNPTWCQQLSEYFRDLADHWKGWDGSKRWQAGEGEFSIDSAMSKQGHVFVRITVNVYGSPSDWIAMAELDIESSQLDHIARAASRFFGPSKSGSG